MADESPCPSPEQLARYAERFNRSQTLRFFGVRISFPSAERVEARLDVRDEQRGGLGGPAVNGGVIAAIFDLVIGCTPALLDPTRRTATMQLSMSFERPVEGELLVAEAWIDRAGGTTVFSSAVVRDAQGRVCARASGLARISKRTWSDGGSPASN